MSATPVITYRLTLGRWLMYGTPALAWTYDRALETTSRESLEPLAIEALRLPDVAAVRIDKLMNGELVYVDTPIGV